MYKFFEEIEEYLKQNEHLEINDIVVNYDLSILMRRHESFLISEKYDKNESGDTILDKECYMGDISFNNKQYRLLCDITLPQNEIEYY
jgi:hypothetical protein